MANEVDYSPVKYVGNGATTDFSFDWKVIEVDELVAELENIETGETTALTRGSDYSATVNSVGGAVTFLSAPSSDYYVVLSRATSQYQSKGYSTSTGFQGSEIEKSFDKVSCNLQEMDYNIETFKEDFTEEINETVANYKEEIESDIEELTENVNTQISEFESEVNSTIATVTEAAEKINALEEAVATATEQAQTATEQAAAASESAESASETLSELQSLYDSVSSDIENLADTSLTNLTETGVDLIRVVTDGVYEPVNLEEKFADEIAEYSSVWTWIQARIQAADFSGIHIGDYIPLTLTGGAIGSDYEITEGQEHKMQVAGIDTYYNQGDTAIPHHIDFISMNTIGEYILFNGGASNNGTASEPNPWLASGVYAVLNGVNNYTTSAYNSLKHGYDASGTGGVLQMLPDDLQSVIITKRTWAEEQYSSSALVNYPTGYGWKDYGYLWVPHEIEVCGYQPCSYNNGIAVSNGNLTKGSFKMYPLFRYSTRIRTSADDNETRQVYWSCVPSNSAATKMCGAGGTGIMDSITTSTSNISVCFGFRIG